MFRSWNGPRAIAYREREHIAHDLGTAVNVQAMVFGNRDDNSGTGVGFTRDPATGAKGAYGDFLVNAQGEDVVAGIRNTEPISELKKQFPKVHAELLKIFARLEAHYRDMCDTEFTIEQGKLWMLQTRVGKRTGAAALKMAVDMVRPSDLGISKAEAVSRITEDHLDSVLHPQFAGSGYAVWAKGLGASPGAAVGRIYFTADDAAEAAERGEQVILVRNETSPEDVHGMLAVRGHPHRPRRPGQPRRRRGPRAGASRPSSAPRCCAWATAPGDGGRRDPLRGRLGLPRRRRGHRRGRVRCPSRRPSRRPPSTPSSRGPTRSARATWPSGPTPTPATTRPTRASSAPRASACAAPSTCSWARTACPSCAA